MTAKAEDEFQAAMIVGAATVGVVVAMAADWAWIQAQPAATMAVVLYPGHFLGGLAGAVIATVVQPRVLRASGFAARALEAGVRGAALTAGGVGAGHVMMLLVLGIRL
jgi:lysylphosphatidylglycerol synthetase-like protein (DUF2156 family)